MSDYVRDQLEGMTLEDLQELVMGEHGIVPGQDATPEELITILVGEEDAAEQPAPAPKRANGFDHMDMVWAFISNDRAEGGERPVYACTNGKNVLVKREVWVKMRYMHYRVLNNSTEGTFVGKRLKRSKRYNIEMRTLEQGPGDGEVFGR